MNSSWSYKLMLSRKILNAMKNHNAKEISPTMISKILLYGCNKNNGNIHLKFNFKSYKKLFPDSTKEDFQKFLKVENNDYITTVVPSGSSDSDPEIVFDLNQQLFFADVLLNKCLHTSEPNDPKEHIVLDYRDVQVMEVAGARKVPLLKSDGSTLYLSRDVAAALDRWVMFRFDRMLYIVDNSQNQHFSALKQVLKRLDYDWADSVDHVKFGRIKGMSSRKGQVVFLNDILNEAKQRMAEKQRQSATTKNFSEEVSDILGVSAIIVNDLKQRRMKDYSFEWDLALQMEGDSGVKLQYTHSRLCSLELNCGVSLPDHCDTTVLSEPVVQDLVLEITRFEEAVERAHSKLEAHEIVTYLFKLCNKTSQALKLLNVKHQSAGVAEQRLLLFHRVRTTLSCGMKLLGLQPLTEM